MKGRMAHGRISGCILACFLLVQSALAENTLRLSLEPLFDIREAERLVSSRKADEERFRKLVHQFSGQVYYVNTQVDLKSLYVGVSLQEVYPSFMLPECENCQLAKSNNSLLEKFGQVFKVKCPQAVVYNADLSDCLPYNETGRGGSSE